VCLFELYFRQISSFHDIFRCRSSRIGEYWQVPTWRHFTTIIMSWNTVYPRSQIRFEIVWEKCWDLLNNIGDTTKRLMSSTKCRSVEVINNPARLGSNHREVNCINYKQQDLNTKMPKYMANASFYRPKFRTIDLLSNWWMGGHILSWWQFLSSCLPKT
jgi:hypothetical protein